MITEDYVSFEVAKLLKEKGFEGDISAYYHIWDTTPNGNKVYSVQEFSHSEAPHLYIPAPTLQMAMKWLREVYHIEINITFGFPFIDGKQQYKYFWSIVRVCDSHLEYPMDDPNSAYYNEEMADSFEEAVEVAIKYCLENLI